MIHVADQAAVTAQDYLRVVLEADLNDFVVQAEKNCVLGANPLFDDDYNLLLCVGSCRR